jgi:TonB family protein
VEHPLQIASQVKPPVAIQTPDIEFPKDLLPANVAPHFVVGLVVDQRGLPQNIRMIRGMSDTLDRYALEAVRQYRFNPATLNGQPVAVALNIEINIDPSK